MDASSRADIARWLAVVPVNATTMGSSPTERSAEMNRTLSFSPTERRMIELAKTFPTFARRPEFVDPWRPPG